MSDPLSLARPFARHRKGRSLRAIKKIILQFVTAAIAALRWAWHGATKRSPSLRRFSEFVLKRLMADVQWPRSPYRLHLYYPTITEHRKQQAAFENLFRQPLISVVLPTYNTPTEYLAECIDSVLDQSYPKWELCIADDASSDPSVRRMLMDYAERDPRIKVKFRDQNGHISAATNSAIELANGEYIALLDHDDILWPNALFEMAQAINRNPLAKLFYSDEDKVSDVGREHSAPFLKPGWSPEFLESCNYITHFACIEAGMLKELGGLRVGCEGAQDWDLFLRIGERTQEIVHVPKVLYSWRAHSNSTCASMDAKPYVYAAQRKVLEDHLERTEAVGTVAPGVIKVHSTIYYQPTDERLTVVLHGRERGWRRSLRSVKRGTDRPFDVVLVGTDARVRQVRRILHQRGSCQTGQSLADAARTIDRGSVLFLRAGIHSKANGWLETLLGDAGRSGVGAVGPKIFARRGRYLREAGIGVGLHAAYGSILSGLDGNDLHYMRGLYAHCRRNVAALSHDCLLVSKAAMDAVGGVLEETDDYVGVDLCLRLLEVGYRNIYNPCAAVIDARTGKLPVRTPANLRWMSSASAGPSTWIATPT